MVLHVNLDVKVLVNGKVLLMCCLDCKVLLRCCMLIFIV